MKRLLPVLLMLAPSVAMAHPGHSGFLHPFTGLDHVLAMTGVGLWAAMNGGKARWALPGAFLAAMAVGGAVGGMAVEPVILASVILLDAAVTLALRAPLWAALPLVALFGYAHGAAHGIEGAYGLGMLASTALLHGLGLALGATLNRSALRLSGAVAMLAGITLALAG